MAARPCPADDRPARLGNCAAGAFASIGPPWRRPAAAGAAGAPRPHPSAVPPCPRPAPHAAPATGPSPGSAGSAQHHWIRPCRPPGPLRALKQRQRPPPGHPLCPRRPWPAPPAAGPTGPARAFAAVAARPWPRRQRLPWRPGWCSPTGSAAHRRRRWPRLRPGRRPRPCRRGTAPSCRCCCSCWCWRHRWRGGIAAVRHRCLLPRLRRRHNRSRSS